MARRSLLLLATVIAALAVVATPAHACSVVGPFPSSAEVVRSADLAVYGRVTSVRPGVERSGPYEATIRIYRVYRGQAGPALRVAYDTDPGVCGTTLTLNERIGLVLDRPARPYRISAFDRISRDDLDRVTRGRFHRPSGRLIPAPLRWHPG